MNILPVLTSNIYTKNQQLQRKTAQTTMPKTAPLSRHALSNDHFISFKSQNSTNLSNLIENLEDLEALSGKDIIPSRVRETAYNFIGTDNAEKLTLMDVHRKAYEGLKQVKTLEEAKKMYPEFANVLSVKEIKEEPGLFLTDVKQGKCKNFNKDEDIALRLLKLYWADGFSITDLRKFANEKSVGYAMQKLRIPLLNHHYALVLRFADSKYYERLTKEMSDKTHNEQASHKTIQDVPPLYCYSEVIPQKIKHLIETGSYNAESFNQRINYFTENAALLSKKSADNFVNNVINKNDLTLETVGENLLNLLSELTDSLPDYETQSNNSPLKVLRKRVCSKDMATLYIEVAKTLIKSDNREALYNLGKRLNELSSTALHQHKTTNTQA